MKLQRVPLTEVASEIAKILPRFPVVSGAYLFGSCLGNCRPDSDIDLALILANEPEGPLDDTTDVAVEAALGTFDGHPYHVTTLSARAVSFSFNVVRSGQLVYLVDRRRIGEFLSHVVSAHDDLEPFLKTYRRERERVLHAFR